MNLAGTGDDENKWIISVSQQPYKPIVPSFLRILFQAIKFSENMEKIKHRVKIIIKYHSSSHLLDSIPSPVHGRAN